MNYRLFCLSALALVCVACQPKTAPGDVPASFFYKGKPVDPACFMDGGAQVGNDTISLDVCSGKNKTQPSYKQDHFYGVEIDDMGGGMTQPYVYYRYIGPMGDDHIIQIVSSLGGTAQFSSLRMVSLDGNLLQTTRRIAGGDRCNGGITEAVVSGNTLSYSQNITPFDLITLTGGNKAGFKAYDDIEASAASCIGTADYVNGQLKTVTLTLDPRDETPENQNAKNACFYGSYNEFYKAGATLDADRMKSFGQTFNSRCGQLAGQ